MPGRASGCCARRAEARAGGPPVATAVWKAEVDDADIFDQLELHNARRAAKGLEPQTMAEYDAVVRRRGRAR